MLFKVERYDWGNSISLFAADSRGENRRAYAQPVVFEETEDDYCNTPFMTLDPESMQRLVDELWHSGFRPSKHIDEASQVEAVKYHLEDMRKLVFLEHENRDSGEVSE